MGIIGVKMHVSVLEKEDAFSYSMDWLYLFQTGERMSDGSSGLSSILKESWM